MSATVFEKMLHHYRPTDVSVESEIASEHYWLVPDTYCTVCALVMINGFTVIAEAACASAEVFDAAKGRSTARANAIKKLIPYACYALRARFLTAGVSS